MTPSGRPGPPPPLRARGRSKAPTARCGAGILHARPTASTAAACVLVAVLVVAITGCDVPLGVLPDYADSPIDTTGYVIEPLPVTLAASFARGNDVYLGLADGTILRADDRDLASPWANLNSPLDAGPRMLFASSAGVVFASHNDRPTWRTADGGQTWAVCLDAPVWRMDEDDLGNLYAGNYVKDAEHVATLHKSADGGATWTIAWQDARNHHIHTVRWDDRAKRLYIAYGDTSAARGQAYSDDRGATFTTLAEGRKEGHTDVAFTRDYVIWASDDQTGRILRVARNTGRTHTLEGSPQFMWFAVAGDEQVYVGTMTAAREGGQRAALLASEDQGATWRKLIETGVSDGPYGQGFIAESRALSAGGWLYCWGGGQSYRVRRAPR